MNNNFKMFNEFYDAQKKMFESWQNMYSLPEEEAEVKENEESNYNPMNYFKDVMELNKKLYTGYKNDPYKVFTNIKQSNDIYEQFFKFWQKIKEYSDTPEEFTKKNYEEWTSQYADYMKKNYIAYAPKPMNKIFEESMKVMDLYKTELNKFMEPWINSEQKLNDAFLKGFFNNPSGYLDYLKLWKENYDKSYSKLINIPMMGIDRELLERQLESFDKFVHYNVVVNEFSANIYKLTQDTMEKVFHDYMKMHKEGIEPKTFEEFYKYSSEQINESFNKLYFSDEFSKLVGHVVEAMSNLKIEVDKLWEEYFSFIPVPKKTEMESVYKTIYGIKKEMKSRNKEMDEIKTYISEQKSATKSKNKSSNSDDVK